MIRYIFGFCPVKVWQDTVDINTLPYCRIPLQPELVPQFCLSCQYERHGTHGIESVNLVENGTPRSFPFPGDVLRPGCRQVSFSVHPGWSPLLSGAGVLHPLCKTSICSPAGPAYFYKTSVGSVWNQRDTEKGTHLLTDSRKSFSGVWIFHIRHLPR